MGQQSKMSWILWRIVFVSGWLLHFLKPLGIILIEILQKGNSIGPNSFPEVHSQQRCIATGFDLQGLFADLRPKMTRYSSFKEVNAVLVELEEHEPVSTDKANSEKHSDTEKPQSRSTSGSISVNGQIHANGIEENGRVH